RRDHLYQRRKRLQPLALDPHSSFPGRAWERTAPRLCLARQSLGAHTPRQSLGARIMPKVVIVGAGISGLAFAYRLQQRLPAVDLTLLEQRSRPGGTVWTTRRDGFQLEAGPNGFLDTKPTTLSLARELGLADHLVAADEAASKNRYLFLGDGLKRLP